jgi:dephospho-CoA kinase
MVFKVGLTGGVASGKTTVSELFSAMGVEIIDADVIARRLLDKGSDCYHSVLALFGPQVLLDNDEINRAWLRNKIFTDVSAKQQLEAIIHPRVRQQMLAQAEQCRQPYCILSIPLLTEATMQDLVDRVLVVDTVPDRQLARLTARDGISNVQAQQMLAGQAEPAQRLAIADDVIDNNGSAEALAPLVSQLHQQYLKLAAAQA